MRETSASEPSTRHRKAFRRHQNRSPTSTPGEAWRKPAYWPRGVRCIEGVTLIWAFVRNLRTWPAMPRERHKGGNPRPKVLMRRSGTDSSVVVAKRGNACGAKGGGHLHRDHGPTGNRRSSWFSMEGGSLQRVARAV